MNTRPFVLVIILTIGMTLSGCLRSSTTVIVKRDGSAIVRDTMLFTGMMAMLQLFGDEAGNDHDNPMMSDSSLQADAAAFGPDVRVASRKSITKGDASGYTADFFVPDINKLTLFRTHAASKLATKDDATATEARDSTSMITFTYEPGSLTIHNPSPHGRRADETTSAPETDTTRSEAEIKAGMAMMRSMFNGMRMTVRVRIDGKIKKTTATHVKRSNITLLDIDMSKLLKAMEKDPDLLDQAGRVMGSNTPDETLLKRLPKGIAVIEFQPHVTVKF